MQIAGLKGSYLSMQQTRLWPWQQENQLYQAQSALLLEGDLNTEILQRALQQMIDQNEILHTRFYSLPEMDVPMQVIGHPVGLHLPIVNLENLCDACQKEQIKACSVALSEQAFDLEHGPLLRIWLFRMSMDTHVFLLSLPALCADASTLKLFIAELWRMYPMFQQGQNFIDDPLQYIDVAAWQRQLLVTEEAQKYCAYWSAIGGLAFTSQRLPFERVVPLSFPRKGQFLPRQQETELEPEIVQQVEALAQAASVTMEAVLLASWQLLLWRFLEQTDLVLGVCCDGRPYEELSTAFGLYSRVVPFKTAISAHVSFGRYLTLVHASLEQAHDAQLYFTWGAEDLAQSCESSSYLPLCFEFVSWPAELMAGGLRGTLLEVSCYQEPFALKLLALQVGSRLRLQMHYDPHRFSSEQIATLRRSFQTLLQEGVIHPQMSLTALPLLTAAEQQRLVQSRQQLGEPHVFQGLIQRFGAQVVRYPQRLAARCGEEALSYQELEWQSNQLARALCAWGVEPGMLVALYLERSLLHLVALLAVLKVGAGYVPLDPEQPVARIQAMLDGLSDGWLVTQEQLKGRLNGRAGRCLCLDGPAANWREETKDPLDAERAPDPEEIAYVIYTSGSTGEPKGVMIRQGSVSNYIQAMCAKLQAQPGWQWASVSTLAADLGNTLLFGALASGGEIHLVSSEVALHGEALGQYLRTQQIDVLKLVPSHLSAVLESGLTAGPRQWLLLGGEALRVELVQRVRELGGTCRMMNHYGPTESTIGAVVEEVGALEPVPSREELVPIGRSIANLYGSVLDERQQVVPVGMVGELYLGGAGLGRGYLERPEQTAERWVPDPYGEEEGARLYRTGDRVRAREDGRLEYVGRSDRQVKLRGYRIELGEIETILTRHLDVRESAVLMLNDNDGEQYLVAYVVSRSPLPSSSALRTYLTEQVPTYMIPAAFIFLRTFPLTPNGKIDRQVLAKAQKESDLGSISILDQVAESKIYLRPRDEVEFKLLNIWEDVLNKQPISILDNFFDLGGHSILAVRLVSRIYKEFGQDLALATFFQYPTIAELGVALRLQTIPVQAKTLVKLQPHGLQPPFFCIHPSGSDVFCYTQLARYMGQDRPFYALQSSIEESFTTVEEMAAYYIASIQTIEPQGPYFLGGWSLGGIVAFEMAQQLRQKNHQVALLAIIDSDVPIMYQRPDLLLEKLDTSDIALAKDVLNYLNIIVDREDFSRRTPEEQFKHAYEQAKAVNALPIDTDLQVFRRIMIMRKTHMHAAHIYAPQIYPDQITLFRAMESVGVEQVPLNDRASRLKVTGGWEKLTAKEIQVHLVPGKHSQLIEEPNVQILAAMLKSCLGEEHKPIKQQGNDQV